jgi:hypothetical protein
MFSRSVTDQQSVPDLQNRFCSVCEVEGPVSGISAVECILQYWRAAVSMRVVEPLSGKTVIWGFGAVWLPTQRCKGSA